MRALEIIGIVVGIYAAGVVLFLGPLFLWLAVDRRRSPKARPLKAAVVEMLWAALVQPTLLVGLFFLALVVAPPTGDAEEPTLLLHGWGQNRADFWGLALRLRRRGRGSLHAMNYWFFGPVERSAERLGRTVERILSDTGAERIHIVSHSLGGIVSRTYVEQQGGSDTVGTLVIVASHGRNPRAGGHWGASSKQMHPGSAFLDTLGPPAPDGVRYHALWSHSDQMVLPESASLHGAGEELEAIDQGHLTVLLHAHTANAIARWLENSERQRTGTELTPSPL